MNRAILKYLASIAFILLSFTVLADDPVVPAPDGKIKGAVVDEQTNAPIEYATVALYRADGDKLVTGAVTDYLGHFKLDQPEAGEYCLTITFIGLEEVKSEVFSIGEESKNINLGNFFLKPSASNLDEVEVVAKRDPIEYRIDKKVVNVDKQITTEAGTAVDILETAPSIQIDVEGNVTLRGSSGFTVLIDGKPTILNPSDVLRQIPSSSIENIEIITNPSVRYEPDGATGIINIITKKNRLDGLSGILNANAGSYGQYGGDVQLSYRLNKVNFVFGANYNQRSRPGYDNDERTTLSDDTTYFVTSVGETERSRAYGSIRAGIEYDITKSDFISVAGRIGRWNSSGSSTLKYNEWTLPETGMYTYNSLDEGTRAGDYFGIDAVYQHTFGNGKPASADNRPAGPPGDGMQGGPGPGGQPANVKHILQAEYLFRYRDMNEESTSKMSSPGGEVIGGTKNVEKGPSQSTRINLYYTLPVGKQDKFEAGGQLRMGKSTDITELWQYNEATGKIEFNDQFSNSTDYYRNIYAAYALYAGIAGNFGYQVGIRTEYTDRNIRMTGEEAFGINRWDYFPTVHLSFDLPSEQQLMASYSRRIDRPRGWWLEPFITVQDAYNVRQGNPALKPEYIDSYEVGYLKKFSDNFFSLEGYYRVTHNKVERIRSVFTESVIMTRPENIGNDYSLGLEAMLSLGPFEWWDIELGGNYFNYSLDGELRYLVDNEIITEQVDRSSTNWNSRLNSTFRIRKDGIFQLNSRYNSASVTAQGKSKGYFTLDAAFKVSFLAQTLSVNLQVSDLLGTERREWESSGAGFYTLSKYDPRSPRAVLTVSYRFNNYKSKQRRVEDGGEEL